MNVQSVPEKARLRVEGDNTDTPDITVAGPWTLYHARHAEDLIEGLVLPRSQSVSIDLPALSSPDTAGSSPLPPLRTGLVFRGAPLALVHVD